MALTTLSPSFVFFATYCLESRRKLKGRGTVESVGEKLWSAKVRGSDRKGL